MSSDDACSSSLNGRMLIWFDYVDLLIFVGNLCWTEFNEWVVHVHAAENLCNISKNIRYDKGKKLYKSVYRKGNVYINLLMVDQNLSTLIESSTTNFVIDFDKCKLSFHGQFGDVLFQIRSCVPVSPRATWSCSTH